MIDAQLDDGALIQQLKGSLIRYPQFTALHKQIQECLQLTSLTGEPHCMSLEGQSYAGKTTLILDFISFFGRRVDTPYVTIMDLLYVPVPSPVTIKSLVSQTLDRMGDPAAYRGDLAKLNYRLKKYIRDCGVKVVFLDDFQHLMSVDTVFHMKKLSEWLKALIKETGVCFVVVGIEGAVETVLDSNIQLSRLFAAREILSPFVWDTSNESSIQAFAQLVNRIEQLLHATLSDVLPRAELLYRIHYATDGVMGYVIKLLRYAALLTLKQQEQRIKLDSLSIAFEKVIQTNFKNKQNPFKSPDTGFSPRSTESNDPQATGNRSKRKKPEESSVSDVLSTR